MDFNLKPCQNNATMNTFQDQIYTHEGQKHVEMGNNEQSTSESRDFITQSVVVKEEIPSFCCSDVSCDKVTTSLTDKSCDCLSFVSIKSEPYEDVKVEDMKQECLPYGCQPQHSTIDYQNEGWWMME